MSHAVLVTDFDGTMTVNDFYKLVAARLLPPDALTPWDDYRAGRITHFTALQRIFGRLEASEAQLAAIVQDMAPAPGLADAVRRLQAGEPVERVEATGIAALERAGFQRIDYFEVRNADDLSHPGPGPLTVPGRVLAAALIGKTRLIDNMAV